MTAAEDHVRAASEQRDDSTAAGNPSVRRLLRSNLERVRERIAAASDAGTPPALIAVTKTVSASMAQLLLEEGCVDLAENRATVFEGKVRALDSDRARWHFIGHVQRNKARRILEHVDVLHSIDSVRLASTVTRILAELERTVEVFIEVNLTGEVEKHGLAPADVPEVIDVLDASPHALLRGLMVMGPLEERGTRSTADVFADAGALARSLEHSHGAAFPGGRCRLSMGMSGDLEIAAQHGSDYVRIGSALFDGLERLAS